MTNDNHNPDKAERVEAQLSAYALGQLDSEERAKVEAVLARSEGARRFVDHTRAIGRELAEANARYPAPAASPALREAVEKRIAELPAAVRRNVATGARTRPGQRRLQNWMVTAACLLIAAVPAVYYGLGLDGRAVREAARRDASTSGDRAQARREAVGNDEAGHDSRAGVEYRAYALSADGQPREDEEPHFLDDPLATGEIADFAPQPPHQQESDPSKELAERQSIASSLARRSGPAVEAGGQGAGTSRPRGEPAWQSNSQDQRVFGGAGQRFRGQSGQQQPGDQQQPGSQQASTSPAGPEEFPEGFEWEGYHDDSWSPKAVARAAPEMPAELPGGEEEAFAEAFGQERRIVAQGIGQDPGTLELARAEASLRRFAVQDIEGPAAYTGVPPGIDGVVLTVPRPDQVEISIGGDDGLTKGHSLQVYRITRNGPTYVGKIEVVKADPDRSACKVDPKWLQSNIQRGDRVTALQTNSERLADNVPGTEQYEPIVENPFLPAEEVPLSTFSIDVDTASYANVRRFLREGRWPPPGAVRVEEMVNYFQYDYPGPQGEHPFAIHVEVAGCPWRPEHKLLRIGLKGREIDRKERGPSNLVFLLDVSGSMSDEDKLPLVKQAMRLLTEQLAEDDRVAIVTYRDDAELRLESTRGNEKPRILEVIGSLHASGSTHGSAGIQMAYREAAKHFVKGGTNRVILATDGDLNVGVTDDDELVRLIQKQAKTGVFLTILGVGTGNLKDAKLEKIADRGNGQYAYVDNLREGRKVLVEQMTGSLMTIATDVKIQLDFNFAEVAAYRLIGYENRTLAARDFDDDRKDAGEIGAGHTVTALYEIVPRGAAAVAEPGRPRSKYQRVPPPEELNEAARSGELLTLRLRYKLPDEDESRRIELAVEDAGKRFGRASADFRFAAAVAAFGMVLRDSVYRGDVTLAAVEEYTAGALGEDPKGRRAEFLDLVRRARQVDP